MANSGEKKFESEEEAQNWLIERLSEHLKIPADQIDISERFNRYGLDSNQATGLINRMTQDLGRLLPSTLIWDYPTTKLLAEFLVGKKKAAKQPKSRRNTENQFSIEPIAIIGVSCRFPGKVTNPREYWELLANGVDGISVVPAERWNAESYYDPDFKTPGRMNTKWGGFIKDADKFDPGFFGISPREATQLDPQQRIILELAYEAFEDAGLLKEELNGSRTSVYVGACWYDYATLQGRNADYMALHTATGQELSLLSGRISYTFGLHGPSMTLMSACSSSLVAVHQACMSLWVGESSMALAGGININYDVNTSVAMAKLGTQANDGKCKAFDHRANGYVRGEGGGLLVLKPLQQAQMDNDPIYCVIRGTAVNNDGPSNGLTAPNPKAQVMVLEEAYRRAGINPGEVQYVEPHGPGTPLGDPIEASALGTVLGAGGGRPPDQPLILSSVKTNIGHLEAAAGIAGLIKAVLSVKNHAIPKTLHFEKGNPNIDFKALNLKVQTRMTPWPRTDRPHLAGVNAFGFGGTNAHVIIEEHQQDESLPFMLSAKSPEELKERATVFMTLADTSGLGLSLEDLCLSACRLDSGTHRLGLAVRSRKDLVKELRGFLAGEELGGRYIESEKFKAPSVVFVFSGGGSQWPGMGRRLFESEPVFRAKFEECERVLSQWCDFSIIDELYTHLEQSRMEETDVKQISLFAVQVALSALWRSWGVTPNAIVGHSGGEMAAAHIAGILNLEDAALVIFHRSRLQKQTEGQGSMAMVEISMKDAEYFLIGLEDRISIAVNNSPFSTVLVGEKQTLETLVAKLEADGIICRTVRENFPAHSHHLDPLKKELAKSLADIRPRSGQVPMFSTVTGNKLDGQEFGADYWVKNMRKPVLFQKATEALLEAEHDLFLEIAPHPVLSYSMKQTFKHYNSASNRDRYTHNEFPNTYIPIKNKDEDAPPDVINFYNPVDYRDIYARSNIVNIHDNKDVISVTTFPSMLRQESEREVIFSSLSTLYTKGISVKWQHIFPPGINAAPLPDSWKLAPEDFSEKKKFTILPLTAHNEKALTERARTLLNFVRQNPALPLQDICYTHALRRTWHEHRLSIVCDSRQELENSLEAFTDNNKYTGMTSGSISYGKRKLVFVFSGQGSQWWKMGRILLEQYPVFRDTLEAFAECCKIHITWSLLEELLRDETKSHLDGTQIAITQVSLCAIQIALCELWQSWGVVPTAVVGHSMGEVAAAFAAGILSMEDAARVICVRSKLLQQATGKGSMAMVELTQMEALKAISGHEELLSIAAVNSPYAAVLSGDEDTLDLVLAKLDRKEIFHRKLRTTGVAGHSPQIDPVLDELVAALKVLKPLNGQLPYFSAVTGNKIEGTELNADYWRRNIREPVLFANAINAAVTNEHKDFLEISVHPVLAPSITQCLKHKNTEGLALSCLRRKMDDRAMILDTLGKLFVAGHKPNWSSLFPEGGCVVSLPTYPWQHKRYWVDTIKPNVPSSAPTQETALPDKTPPPPSAPQLPGVTSKPEKTPISTTFHGAKGETERQEQLQTHIKEHIAQVMNLAQENIPLNKPLKELGMDSIMAGELQNRLQASMELHLNIAALFNHPTVSALAKYLTERTKSSTLPETAPAPQDTSTKVENPIPEKKETVSDSAQARLSEKLAAFKKTKEDW